MTPTSEGGGETVTGDSDEDENLPTTILMVGGILVAVVVIVGFVGYKLWVNWRSKSRVQR